MANPNNENSPSIEFFFAEFDDLQFSPAGELDPSTDVFTEEDYERLINGPPINVASHQSGVDGSMDIFAQTDDGGLTMAFVAFETTMENNVESNMGTVEVTTNAATTEVNIIGQMDGDALSMACMGMGAPMILNVESSMGIEVATNVATTEVDTIFQTDGDAPTLAPTEIGATVGLNVASSIEVATNVVTTEADIIARTNADASTVALVPYIGTGEVATNVATTELGMTNGMAAAENDDVVQNTAINNWTMNVYNSNQRQRKVSRFSLDERLQGWTIKILPRPKDTTRTDRFFVHFGSGIQFRSKNEVDDFIYFGYHPKRQANNVAKPVNNSAEASTSNGKRSTKRNINWKLNQRGVLPDGITPIYDINFLEPGAKQNPNSIILSEGTIRDPEADKRCKRRKTKKLLDDQESAEAFQYETHQVLRIKDKGDNGEEQAEDEDEDKDKDKDKDKDMGKGKGKMYED